jgi:type II secretory pathway pseudopilin PulG
VTQPEDRYEPLPSLPEMPRWLWRKLGRRGRIAIALVVLAVVGGVAAAVPGLRESQREADARAQRERAAQRAELIRRLEAEQRPVAGRSGARDAGRADRLAARAAVMGDLAAAIGADARGRARRGELTGTIRRVACEPFPRAVGGTGADEDLARRTGRFSCVAVTAEFEGTAANPGGVIGHGYRARVDFRSGRYAFCKITGRAGPEREQVVTIPRVCGG